MQKTYQEAFRIRSYQADLNDTLRPTALLQLMQEIAGTHADRLSVGRRLLDERGLAWVLTRVEVHMNRWPRSQEELTIETFPTPNRRWFFPRYFIFRDGAGQEIGCAGSLWILMDIHERKMVNPAELLHLMPDNGDLSAPMGLPATVAEIPLLIAEEERTVRYTDLDVNGHVNNTRYLDWCCDLMGTDVMRTHAFATLMLNFHQEVLPEQVIHTELRLDGEHFSFSGFADGKRHFDVGGTLFSQPY